MQSDSQSRQVTVLNPQGLHARPAHMFVQTASQFKSEVQVERNGECVDGKSILSILTLAAEKGTTLTIRANGEDAAAALDALEQLFLDEFGVDRDQVDHQKTNSDG